MTDLARRRCRYDGCTDEVLFVPSEKTGKPMILNAVPEVRQVPVRLGEKRIVLVHPDGEHCLVGGVIGNGDAVGQQARVVDSWDRGQPATVETYVFTDHHSTCQPHLAAQERKRQAKQQRAGG